MLRLYQINPAATNNKVVANILLKALMQLPKPDFQLCVYQLSEKAQASGSGTRVPSAKQQEVQL